jgi:hypothetical protein
MLAKEAQDLERAAEGRGGRDQTGNIRKEARDVFEAFRALAIDFRGGRENQNLRAAFHQLQQSVEDLHYHVGGQGGGDGYDGRDDGFDGRDDGYDGQDDGFDGRDDGYDGRDDGYDGRDDGYDGQDDGFDGQDDGSDGQDDRSDDGIVDGIDGSRG